MKEKCEICGDASDLEVVYECACSDNSLNATLCKKCREKYFYNMEPGLGYNYFPVLTYAENLVRHYKLTHKGNDSEKEATTMQVSYNGFTGELVKMEQYSRQYGFWTYELHIYDVEKNCTYSFTGVKLADVKFMGGAVAFGG